MSSGASAAPAWVGAARAQAGRTSPRPRMALLLAGQAVGSVDAQIFDEIGLQRLLDKRWKLSKTEYAGAPAWQLQAGGPDDAGAALQAIALALRAAGRCGPWRDEQVAVCNPAGDRLATVERGAVRVLGLATQAVHLVGCTADGQRLWVQQRSLSKPTHPGAWDTLMGGLVSAADTLETALARETWEEAGLHLHQLQALCPGGTLHMTRPCDEGGPGCGWMVERIAWYQAVLPAPLVPEGQDGEVERFECLPHDQVQARLAAGAFTPEAALVLAAYYGW
ncbi:NUDIX domain-containing protein [Pulveribacter sp.]|uniref:NUDIX hydrolase n=1 Tax=Pulveribacter sp. TaxID=2678893 RepID=UPI0028AD6F12|nr:NUDIX domain-containing protein [Pulveribacter sp.]